MSIVACFSCDENKKTSQSETETEDTEKVEKKTFMEAFGLIEISFLP